MDGFKKSVWKLQLDPRAEDSEEFSEPGRMSRPGRPGDEIAVGDRVGHGEIDVRAAGLSHLRTDSGIGAALFPLDDIGRGEDLRAMAEGGNGFIRL